MAEGHACEISVRTPTAQQDNAFHANIFCRLVAMPWRQVLTDGVDPALQLTDLQFLLQNASKNAGEMINKYCLPSRLLSVVSVLTVCTGSRFSTTVSARPPLPVNWSKLLLVPLPPRRCRGRHEDVARGGHRRTGPAYTYLDSACKISVNLTRFPLCHSSSFDRSLEQLNSVSALTPAPSSNSVLSIRRVAEHFTTSCTSSLQIGRLFL